MSRVIQSYSHTAFSFKKDPNASLYGTANSNGLFMMPSGLWRPMEVSAPYNYGPGSFYFTNVFNRTDETATYDSVIGADELVDNNSIPMLDSSFFNMHAQA